MRERMFATLGIWVAVAFAIDRLLASLTYTVWTEGVPQTIFDGTTVPNLIANTEFVTGSMQIAVYVLLFAALMAATGATIAIWKSGQGVPEQRAAATAQETQKMKRDRETRVKRLLSVMDEEELTALEEQHRNEDEMTVAQLIQQKRSTQEMRR